MTFGGVLVFFCMGEAKTESKKPVLSLSLVSLFMGGSYFFGNRLEEQCIFYMNLAGAAALGTWLFCVVGSGVIGAALGLLVNKHFIVKK